MIDRAQLEKLKDVAKEFTSGGQVTVPASSMIELCDLAIAGLAERSADEHHDYLCAALAGLCARDFVSNEATAQRALMIANAVLTEKEKRDD